MKVSFIILSIFLCCSCKKYSKEKKVNHKELTKKIDSIITKNKFNGVICLSTDSLDVYSKAIGFSDFETGKKIDFNNQFIIGSISKQITAVLLLREYEKGGIGLHDTIGKYLTEISQPWAEHVTIHQLLTHTHGIIGIDKPLEFQQGSKFHYSQLGYELLAQILEEITGKTFKNLSEEFFGKHGFKNTHHPYSKSCKDLVKGYKETENGTFAFAKNSLYNYPAAGSFISNVNDLKHWNEKLYSGKLVTKETLKLMSTRYATRIHPIFETVEYGYGILFKNGEETLQIGALGYAPGFVSACYYYPQTKMNLIILENTARKMNDFKQTFKVHAEIMKLIKNYRLKVDK